MKHLTLFFAAILFTSAIYAQDLGLHTVSDTVLRQDRKLEIRGKFDSLDVLKKLFPGKYYSLEGPRGQLINWKCPSCKTIKLTDSNMDEEYDFPYAEGIATRVINVMDYRDSSGTQYKMMAFNHSAYDPDGAQTGRFTGGTLGLAKFALTGDVWKMTFFQPAIGAFGAFANCPSPVPVLIGKDQYAFMIKYFNGGAGAPFEASLHLIVGTGGAYKKVFGLYGAAREKAPESEGLSYWECAYSVSQSDKRFFRDIIVTIRGVYTAKDLESAPTAIKPYAKKQKGTFSIIERYTFNGGVYQTTGKLEIKVD